MAAFAITDAAAQEIRNQIGSSDCERPTASMLDSSQAFPTSPELVDAISRNADESEMLAIAMKEHREREASLDFRLEVGIYEAHDCRPEDLVLIDGLQFALPSPMREYFIDYVLDYKDGNFLLRNGRRVYLRLMDLGKDEENDV